MSADEVLRLDAPLPRGLSVLEASAGTGKTYAITAWATRWLVEGPADGEPEDARTPERLLVVTFTRAAAAELRGRLRGGIRSAVRALDAAVVGDPGELAPWLATLVDVPRDELLRRRGRATAALASFDRATVSTLHAFCRASLASLGLRGDLVGRAPAADLARLRADVVRDLLLDRIADDPLAFDDPADRDTSGLPRTPATLEGRLHDVLKPVFSSAGARLAPDLPTAPAVAAEWADLVRGVADEVRARLERDAELSFDDLIARMDRTLADPALGPVAARALRGRIRLALVDEMQDTDGVQWRVLRRALLDDVGTLGPAADVVLVGDPKQSIYRFRGADVDAYLTASSEADERRSLVTNHRSSPGLLRALDRLLRGATFGHERIAYVPVGPPDGVGPGLKGVGAPLEVRWVPRHDRLRGRGASVDATATDALILDDLAARVVALLGTGTTTPDAKGATRPLRPGDVAVLVRSHLDAADVLAALDAAGVPAVRPRAGSVVGSDAAGQWRTLLAALAAPEDRRRVRSLLMSWFVDGPVERLGDRALTDELTDALQQRCERWRDRIEAIGVLPFLAELRTDVATADALARAGERGLTDLEHVAELLHGELGARPAPVPVALRTLERLMMLDAESQDDADDPSLRRISTDGQAVQILTGHAAKGLEYPVVLLPFLMKAPNNDPPRTFRDVDGRVVDVASWNKQWTVVEGSERASDLDPEERLRLAKEATEGDDARLLYVALTRARDKLVVWWAPRSGADRSSLARLLLHERGDDGMPLTDVEAPDLKALTDELTAERLGEHVEALPDDVEVVELPDRVRVEPMPSTAGAGEERGSVTAIDRRVDDPTARRWSYSTLKRWATGSAAEVVVAVEPMHQEEPSEPGTPADGPVDPEQPEVLAHRDDEVRDDEGRLVGSAASPLDGMRRAGREFGDLVHRVLERADVGGPDPAGAIEAALRTESDGARLEDGEVEQLVGGLVLAARTPLGPAEDDVTLAALAPTARSNEPRFTVPLLDTRTPARLAHLGRVVADALPEGDPYAPLFSRLGLEWPAARAAGWMIGAIDVVLRGPDGRYVVVDYKTTVLRSPAPGAADPDAKVPDYGAARMRVAMEDGLLPLQGLLYLVALHRWLGLRMDGYDPATHLGGSMFLFVRGMAGPATRVVDGVRDGVAVWDPGVRAVLAADALLRGEDA